MNRRDRAVRLAKARQQFHKAQVRVTALETRAAKARRLPTLGEENYHRIFDNLLEGCQIIGFDWRYLYINAAAARQGQQTKEELLDHTLMERYPGIEKTAMFTVLQRCMQERTVENIENEFHYADGTSAWFELKVQPVQEGIFVLSLDITERKNAEEALRRYAQQIEVLHEIDQGIIQATSLQAVVETALKHIRQLIPCQRASVGLFDYENDEWLVFAVDAVANTVLGQGTRFPIQPASIENSRQSEVTVIADLRTLQDPLPAYRQFIQHGLVSVLHAHFAADGRPLGSLNLFADTPGYFTAEHQKIAAQLAGQFAIAMKQKQLAEDLARHAALLERRVNERTAELQMAKERVEAILNNSADGIVLLHPDLRIQQANPSFTRLFACEPDECLGKPLVKFIYREDINTVTQVIQTVVAEQPRKRIEVRAIRKNGALFDAEFSIGLIKGDGLVCVIRDITQRKAQERQLRYQASLQDNVSDAVIVTDPAFHIQSWNRAAERIYGWRAEEVIGKATPAILRTQFVTADDRERSTRQLYEQEWWQGEVLQYHKDGTVRHLLGSITMVKDEHGAPTRVVAVNHDITERKQIEEALRASAAEIFDLYNNAPCGYHSVDQDGVIVQINDTELRWLGYDRADVVGNLKFNDLLAPESLHTFEQNFPLFQERGWIKDLQFTLVRKDGSTMHTLLSATAIYDDDGRFLKSRSTLFDITELKQAQQALAASEARYRLLAENTSDVIGKMNAEGILTFVSSSCYPLLGHTPDELTDKLAIEFVHPDDRLVSGPIMQQALDSTHSSFMLTQRIRHKAGHYIWTELTANIIRDPATGRPTETISVMRDITERKRTEAILMARVEQERAFQAYLKALHEITMELTQLDDLESFYRRAIMLGLAHFGFDRLALFLYDEQAAVAQGTYGTDALGNLVDERHLRFTPAPHGVMLRAFSHIERFCYEENVPLYSDNQPVGVGWNAAAVLWNGTQQLGWLVADNLLQQNSASKPILDILGLYALTIGTLLARKRIQIALRESEARYRLLAENINDVVMRINVANEYTYVSPSCRTVLGYEPAELVGQSAFTYVHPDDLSTIEQTLLPELLQTVQWGNLVVRVRHKQGHYVWLESTGQVIRSAETGAVAGFIASARDISDRKRAEADLKASEEKYRRLIENMRGGLAVYDVNDQVTYINDRACELLGYTRDEVIGTHPYDYIDEMTAQEIKAQLAQRRLRTDLSYELTVRRKDGTPVHLLVSGSPLFDTNGEYSGSLVVTTDITPQKQAEAALRQALAKEQQLGELKSRFISMASHEFRTPLATILALTETLSAYRHKFSEEQIEQRFDKIKDQVDHLKDIMEDVLLLARMQARRVEFNPINLDLDDLCHNIVDEFQSRIDVNHELDYQCKGEVRFVELDPKLMRQIISNLIANAIKYSPADKPIHITLAFRDKAFVLNVHDNGIGIPEADLQHLFEPFHRAANVGTIPGTGLGLVITKEAVELHGGTVAVESQLQRGTTFTIHIPTLQAQL